MQLSSLVDRLDEQLDTDAYAGVDYSANGLQVGPDDKEVETVAFAVDGVVETIEQAATLGADLLVVHHGISWGGIDRITDLEYDRVRTLIENDVALYVSHLPLDGHPELGNAAVIASDLDLVDVDPFGEEGGVTLGQRGHLSEPVSHDELRGMLASVLSIEQADVQVIDHGPDRLERLAILTGGGGDFVREAAAVGADAMITGEGKQKVYHEAQEAGVCVFLAGHYATETTGVRALQSLVETWGLETEFIDVPTGL